MHIEIIGSTSAGKTTLANKMVSAGNINGEVVVLSDDFILEQLHINWIESGFLRRRSVELVAFATCLKRMTEYKEFIGFVLREGKSSPGSWFYKINRMRNVIRKIGIFEFISQRAAGEHVVLADNEGLLQGVHNLFVHQNYESDVTKISRYVDLAPLPDVVLFIQQDEDILVSRTLKRGHARITRKSPENVVHFVNQAVTVFNELVSIPQIKERLLIVDSGMNLSNGDDEFSSIDFNRVANLIHS